MLGHIKSLPYEGSQYGRGGMARSILIINPNSTRAMTEGLERLVSSSSVQPQVSFANIKHILRGASEPAHRSNTVSSPPHPGLPA